MDHAGGAPHTEDMAKDNAYLASQAPACYTPAGAQTALLQFQAWAASCRQAAAMLSRAETALLPVRVFPVYGATMKGPGADRLRRGVEDAILRVAALGSGLGDVEHEMTVIADRYDLKAQTVSAQITQMQAQDAKNQANQPHAEALPAGTLP